MQCNERDLQNVGTREKSEVHGIDIGGKHATTTEVEVGKERVLETELGLCGDIEPFESPNGALELAKTSGKPVPLQPQPEAAEIIAYGRATGSRRRRRREVVGDSTASSCLPSSSSSSSLRRRMCIFFSSLKTSIDGADDNKGKRVRSISIQAPLRWSLMNMDRKKKKNRIDICDLFSSSSVIAAMCFQALHAPLWSVFKNDKGVCLEININKGMYL